MSPTQALKHVSDTLTKRLTKVQAKRLALALAELRNLEAQAS